LKCIFCKQDSSNSISAEHVIPESLGNTKTVLPKGIVCDSCNNYFAAKVEKPVLASGEFTQLRFNQLIKNKKGRVPETKIYIGPHAVTARRNDKLDFSFMPGDFSKIQEYLSSTNKGMMIIPVTGEPPHNHHLSRFLAKMALEALTFRCLNGAGWNDYIVGHEQLDAIRNFARYPKRNEIWEYSKRRIYAEDNSHKTIDGVNYQVMNEWDILVTGGIDDSEFYFVLAVFGMEYAINLGGNSIDGYKAWLVKNNDISPLYLDKNIT
jgi:hypothetical protein